MQTETKPRWRRCRELVDTIIERAREPWVDLQLGGEKLVSVRAGGIALLIGATGRGKTSLSASLLVDHAQRCGPAVSFSLELTADEWTARAIGTETNASWGGVLRGEVSTGQMLQAIPERLVIVDRDAATIDALSQCINDLRIQYPGEPILIAVDYVQLIGADSDDDIRPRIGKVMRGLDQIARDKRVVIVALSQGSRMSSRALNSGEALGAATTDSGAESADLERWATVTIAIGQHGPEAEDGTCAVDLSIGKSRMGGGDRVFHSRFNGRSGLVRLVGDARPAADVRAERTVKLQADKVATAKLAMITAAQRAKTPVTRDNLRSAAQCKREIAKAAIDELLADGEIVRVRRKATRAKDWMLWTQDHAEREGIDVVRGEE